MSIDFTKPLENDHGDVSCPNYVGDSHAWISGNCMTYSVTVSTGKPISSVLPDSLTVRNKLSVEERALSKLLEGSFSAGNHANGQLVITPKQAFLALKQIGLLIKD